VPATSIASINCGSVSFLGPAIPAFTRSSSSTERYVDEYAFASADRYPRACLLFQLTR
jgi:hypothetical protein